MSDVDRPYRLLAPGPVPVPPAVLARMSSQVLHHRTPEFEAILREAWSGLSEVFGTALPVQILCGTGSAAMEAAVVNLISPGDVVVVVVSGKFGERWAEMCERFGAVTHRLNVPWGEAVRPEILADWLKDNRSVRAVLTQAVETSTATLHPVAEVVNVTRRHAPEALVMVDAITAVGCTPLPMDELGIDVMVAGSQKAFAIPTGLSFIALNARAWEAQARSKAPRYYLDLAAERAANERGETFFSTPTPLVTGLTMVLGQVRERGLSALIARAGAMARATRAAGEALGLATFSCAPAPSVTALVCPDGARVRERLERDYNITVMGGQDQLKGKILRVGHMGHVTDEDLTALFNALATLLGRPERTTAATEVLRRELAPHPSIFR